MSRLLSEHFSVAEFTCGCGCGICNVEPRLLGIMEAVRGAFGRPMHIRSGCRCRAHNLKVGGKPRSAHITTAKMACTAADIAVNGSIQRYRLVEAAYSAGVRRIGPHKKFVHIDVHQNLPQYRLWVY